MSATLTVGDVVDGIKAIAAAARPANDRGPAISIDRLTLPNDDGDRVDYLRISVNRLDAATYAEEGRAYQDRVSVSHYPGVKVDTIHAGLDFLAGTDEPWRAVVAEVVAFLEGQVSE
ncbi:hypothetical protein WKY82_10375 [Gordonia malaquae]|uniref:hypothetical protein n=1 Tax=Gordonia malaquae TaxID=410332 RepID=UPI0030C79E06